MRDTESTGSDELDPVDYLVVAFAPGTQYLDGEMGAELARLSDYGTKRILDLLILQTAADESIDETEPGDESRALETHAVQILAAEHIEDMGAATQPGSVAGVLVWKKCRAARLASAARPGSPHHRRRHSSRVRPRRRPAP